MAQPKFAVRGFLFAAGLFLIVAFAPVVRGGSLNATFLALSVVSFVLGIAIAKKNRGPDA